MTNVFFHFGSDFVFDCREMEKGEWPSCDLSHTPLLLDCFQTELSLCFFLTYLNLCYCFIPSRTALSQNKACMANYLSFFSASILIVHSNHTKLPATQKWIEIINHLKCTAESDYIQIRITVDAATSYGHIVQ